MIGEQVAVVPPGGWPRPWLVRACGAVLAVALWELVMLLGLSQLFGLDGGLFRLLALVFGAVIAATRLSRVLWLAGGVLITVLFFVAYTPLVERPALAMVRVDDAIAPVDAIVVFSGWMTDAGALKGQGLDRLLSAMEDAHALTVPHVAASVIATEVNGRRITSRSDQERLARLLGGAVELHLIENVTNTYTESLGFAALARTRGWQHVRVVTSPLHTRRACAALEATGLRVTCTPATPRDVAYTVMGSPGARLTVFRDYVHELIGWRVYRWRGWV